MMKRFELLITVVPGTLLSAAWSPAQAQFINAHPSPPPPPFTPLYEPPPSVHFYALGAQAFRKHDYPHAVDMWKTAASWASQPADYSLGMMYFRGEGVRVDRPLGVAWMKLAAERDDPQFAKVRDVMVSALADAQRTEADALWRALQETYGDTR